MSDAPQGPGWWQASDLKWYPPTDRPGRAPDGPTRRRWLLPSVALVLLAALAVAAITLLTRGRDADASTVTLEPAAAAGPDPFTGSVATGTVTELSRDVRAAAAERTVHMPTDGATGARATTGTDPGLYGGTRDDTACNAGKLVEYLTTHPAKAKAWAATQGIAAKSLPAYIRGLTPAVLTVDTLVTNHGFSNGRATPRASVLQSGTAVLIDATGTPRARCSCGNPLTPAPSATHLPSATITGTRWSGFSTGAVASVRPGDPIPSGSAFTFTDVSTGTTFQHPTGSGAGGTWVAVGKEAQPGSNVQDGRGSVWTSADGRAWEQTATTPGALYAVGWGDGRWVVVGSGPGQDETGGVALTSTDGRTWSQPARLPIDAQDVAYGNGTWVAISGSTYATSTDGTTWTAGAKPLGDGMSFFTDSVVFDGTRFTIALSQGAYGLPYGTVTSTDGRTWSTVDESTSADGSAIPALLRGLAFTDRIGAVGQGWSFPPDGQPMSSRTFTPAAATADASGRFTAEVTVAPPDLEFAGLGTNGAAWVTASPVGPRGMPTSSGIWTSADLGTWAQVGSVDGIVSDVQVGGGGAGGPAGGTSATGGTTTTTTRPTGTVDRSAKVLQGLSDLERVLATDPGVPSGLAEAATAIGKATGAAWTPEMVTALASSACAGWQEDPADPEAHTFTEQGYTDWATALAPALGITPKQARTAIDSRRWAPFQRLCG